MYMIENLRECDSSKCLLCSRRPGDPERYVDNSDLPTFQYPDVLEGLVVRYGVTGKKRTAAESHSAACYPCPRTSEEETDVSLEQIVPQQCGDNDAAIFTTTTTTGRLSKISSQKDLLVPDVVPAVSGAKKESYLARESNRDLRDKVISSIDFRRGGEFFSTATTCKEICIHKIDPSTSGSSTGSIDPRWVHRAPSKLSKIVWNNNSNVVTVGDFDGQLTPVDVETGHIIAEIDEKSNSAILDLKRNKHFHTNCLLTASKSGAVKLWSEDLHSFMPIVKGSSSGGGGVPVCSVSFNPLNANLVATALANSMLCVYDIRNCEVPIYTTDNVARENPVAHIEYCSRGDLVCSTLNSEISKWENDVLHHKRGRRENNNLVSLQLQKKGQSFRGHKLTKHFVGLSVNHRDFIATGSEDGKAYVYHDKFRSCSPVAVCDVAASDPTCTSSCCNPSPHAHVTPITTAVEWIPSSTESDSGTMGLLVASGMKIDRFEFNLDNLY